MSKDINSFASKVDRRKIVEVNAEWKLYKEVSTLTLKEGMLLFLAFGSRSVERCERCERSSQILNKH